MRLLPRRAESLVESIIAITVITLSTTAALVLIQTSIGGNRVIGEKVFALNLALEGIEAVKNIRDTNYLNFASNPEECWNSVNATAVSNCATRDLMEDGDTYYLKRNLRNEEQRLLWTLETNSAYGDISHYEIYDSSGSTVIAEMYAQSGLESFASFSLIEEDVYTRVLEFSENDYDPDNAIDVTSTVSWENKGNTYTVSLTRTIANVY